MYLSHFSTSLRRLIIELLDYPFFSFLSILGLIKKHLYPLPSPFHQESYKVTILHFLCWVLIFINFLSTCSPFRLTLCHICDFGFLLLIDSRAVSLEIKTKYPLTNIWDITQSVPIISACPKLLKTGSVNIL